MRNLNAVPLSAIRVIEAIARTGSLVRAADELGATPGALSQRLAKAEAILGQPLFLRFSTGLRPTESCARIVPRLTLALTELSASLAELQKVESTTLTVTVAPIFASRWLIWRIGRFNQKYPAISLRLLPTIEVIDLDHSDIDVGIRFSSDSSAVKGAFKLFDQRVFPVCSPELSRSIQKPLDLFQFPIIRENDRLSGWGAWLAAMDLGQPDMKLGPTYADGSLCLDAAMLGQGIFMAWQTLASDALERGQIVAPFSDHVLSGASYWFVTNHWSAQKPAVRQFRDWLNEEMACSLRYWQDV
jgi:DNA-binding transcriptional LysR family regulator